MLMTDGMIIIDDGQCRIMAMINIMREININGLKRDDRQNKILWVTSWSSRSAWVCVLVVVIKVLLACWWRGGKRMPSWLLSSSSSSSSSSFPTLTLSSSSLSFFPLFLSSLISSSSILKLLMLTWKRDGKWLLDSFIRSCNAYNHNLLKRHIQFPHHYHSIFSIVSMMHHQSFIEDSPPIKTSWSMSSSLSSTFSFILPVIILLPSATSRHLNNLFVTILSSSWADF